MEENKPEFKNYWSRNEHLAVSGMPRLVESQAWPGGICCRALIPQDKPWLWHSYSNIQKGNSL